MGERGGHRWRRTLLAVGGLTCLAALVGTLQLVTSTFTPPVSDLEPLGLHSWLLPGLWLAASVVVPSASVVVLAVRHSPRLGSAAVLAGALLALELVVQIPFVGPDPLQGVMGLVGVALVALGLDARRAHAR